MKITVVTPSYNQGCYIERTIQSVLNQHVMDVEYLIADGGSTDETVSILKKYDGQLRWLSEKDNGQAHAVNKAIALTSGDIIAWINSDDIYYPDAFVKVSQYFAEHPDVDVIYGKANQIDGEDKIIEPYPTEAWDLQRLKIHCFLSQPATFFRRSVVDRFGSLDESLNFCMDYEYWLRLGLRGAKFAYLPDVLSGTRIYADTKSSRYFLQAHHEAISMLQKTLGYVPSAWIVNYSTAKVKSETKLKFPDPRFVAATWMNLWGASGIFNSGISRVSVWLQAQAMMLQKFVCKLVARQCT